MSHRWRGRGMLGHTVEPSLSFGCPAPAINDPERLIWRFIITHYFIYISTNSLGNQVRPVIVDLPQQIQDTRPDYTSWYLLMAWVEGRKMMSPVDLWWHPAMIQRFGTPGQLILSSHMKYEMHILKVSNFSVVFLLNSQASGVSWQLDAPGEVGQSWRWCESCV